MLTNESGWVMTQYCGSQVASSLRGMYVARKMGILGRFGIENYI